MESRERSPPAEVPKMNTVNNPIAFDSAVEPTAETLLRWFGTDFRPELAFPELTEDMVERLRH